MLTTKITSVWCIHVYFLKLNFIEFKKAVICYISNDVWLFQWKCTVRADILRINFETTFKNKIILDTSEFQFHLA